MEQKKNYDSEFCGSLPIHLINHVQPYAILIVLRQNSFKILQVSENIETITGLAPQDVVNRSIADFISAGQAEQLRQKFATGISGKIPLRISFKGKEDILSLLALIHAKDDFLLMELEPAAEEGKGELFTDVYQEVKYAMAEINAAETTGGVCHVAIKELKRLSGFDKIIAYKFDEDWNGEVIAEIMEEGMESYIGLHFPASDIPKQARALYLKNPYRLIPSIDYTPVKIYPIINPVTNGFVDIGNCNVRSVPAVHVEYLKNMGVMASMSTAIIKDEKLWGLISCHHRQPKYLNYEMCSVFELMAGIISARVSSIQNKEQFENLTRLQQIQAKLMEQVYLDDDPVTALTKYDTNILGLLGCEGAVIVYNRKMQTIGNVPDRYEIKELVLWLQSNNIDRIYNVINLSAVYDSAAAYTSTGSGIIVLPVHIAKGEYIIGFKPEVIQSVNWGGNPNEAINFDKNNITYHPRNSFSLWKQTFRNTSLPWKQDELLVAESFRNFLIEYTLKKVYAML